MFASLNWHGILVPDTPLLEIFVRGTIIYLGLFFMLRFALSRQSGNIGVTDVLVIVLIADAAQNGMAADYQSSTDGLFLVATIIFWDYALDWLSYHSRFFNALVNPREVILVRDGRPLRHNMKREMITMEELMSHVRSSGLETLEKVQCARMESGGQISIVPYGQAKPRKKKKKD